MNNDYVTRVSPRRSFWVLVLVAVLSMGALSTVLKANPSPIVGAAVALSSAALAVCLTLAARILLALDHARRSARQPTDTRIPLWPRRANHNHVAARGREQPPR